jgi:CO/xanthine dehydrogenase FAD-binding subunit
MLDAMSVVVPTTLSAALAALAEKPDAHILAGGTDFMVEVNFGHRRPQSVISISRISELRQRVHKGDTLFLGATTTYADLEAPDVVDAVPALALAARTVGSPQIRNAGTIGGNVGTGSPAGDLLPVLAALNATIHLRSISGAERVLAWHEFFLGPKRTARLNSEILTGVTVPVTNSRQEYLKVGTRNAMVISVAGLALIVDLDAHTVACGLGSVGPTPLRAPEAEAFACANIDWSAVSIPDPRTYETFAALVAEASRPIDDHRSTANYRRHAVKVMAQRALLRLI